MRQKLPDIDKLNKLAAIKPAIEAKRKLNEYHRSLYGFSIPKIGGLGVQSCVKQILEQSEKTPVPKKPSKPVRKTRKPKAEQVEVSDEVSVVELQDKIRDTNRKFISSNTYIEYYKPMRCRVNGSFYPIQETLWNWIETTENWYACPHMYPYFSEQVHKGIQSILYHLQNHGSIMVRVDDKFHKIII